jgi:hypothetical protein
VKNSEKWRWQFARSALKDALRKINQATGQLVQSTIAPFLRRKMNCAFNNVKTGAHKYC